MNTTIAAAAVVVALGLAGCQSDHIVTTPTSPPAPETTEQSQSAAPAVTAPNLANSALFYARTGPRAGYYFTAPSGRWRCVIVARTSAGCQSATGTALPIAGIPQAVVDGAGEEVAPNTIVVERRGGTRFAWREPADFTAAPAVAPPVLPFDTVLAVAGFRCVVAQEVGISCRDDDSGDGFTFSAEGYTEQYTESPPR